MEIQKINGQTTFLPAAETPLSANVVFIQCGGETWIFDVGCSDEAAEKINSVEGKKNIVLSHFHPDHTGNIERVSYDELYAGAFTCKRFKTGTTVNEHMFFESGIHLFPLPSGHAKGSIGLEYKNCAFLGDAVYSMKKNGRIAYNAELLKKEIAVLKSLDAERFFISHSEPFGKTKAEVVEELERIYMLFDKHEPYIFLD